MSSLIYNKMRVEVLLHVIKNTMWNVEGVNYRNVGK